jgi:hypothetical protein
LPTPDAKQSSMHAPQVSVLGALHGSLKALSLSRPAVE